MINYWKIRLQNYSCLYSLIVGFTISIFHIIFFVLPISKNSDIIFSPYTSWLSMNFASFYLVLFMLLLPIISSLPASGIYLTDKKNGTLDVLFTKISKNKYYTSLMFVVFISGFLVTCVSLTINIIGCFLLLPNNPTDEILNYNLGMRLPDAFGVSLYFSHPFIHMILNVLFISVYGGLFALISTISSFFIRNTFFVYLSSFLFQVVLIAINLFLYPIKSIAPAFFLPENPYIFPNSFIIVIVLTLLISISLLCAFYIGRKQNEFN
ncbi:hypothetical protein CYV26_11555 [Carnobacterium maltaromaticum]|uniref:hypothetical protein n=1 Tax=Carnobacterium maltaromaticum TaxID=2751 RepID=UPI000C767579|nr:hypothetical protein [Carnobacterium maltaromaticum]PLS33744.1 hypothetical protein CYV33_11540 [Carnobacterium maltaromaticum]PLS35726.1 hypothetical protein CYV30_08365 [Carnobacterium maltaromaticum]PLS36175.1 hypothetical protein CYV31_08370 [Carnobacterium maltaromaticum]PLS42632.1 hypothetical protein CYV27_11540 [Carnobacterium maltaromaticum]PLS42867.1 hypothetical protein CYV28_08380 [Carnobacterium maltaromaticum]